MESFKLQNNRLLENYGSPYIVAEVNTSHNGSVETAKKMILEAKEAGCECVKFQSWSSESLYSKTFYKENPIAKRIYDKFSMSESELKDLAQYCTEQNIAFSSTPYSRREVDFLVDVCKVPYIKIASMDINNYSFLEYIAHAQLPIVLATGMADISEIEKAVNTIEKTGNSKICLLHCISLYPPQIEDIHLNNIIGLRKHFLNCVIGFSDHSLGIEMATAAVALGAAMIEKHFTLDKTKIGMDNQMAIEPNEMQALVQNCKNVNEALGSQERRVTKEELEQRRKMRRSVVTARDLKAGTIISENDLDVKRPGDGMLPEKIPTLIGRVIAHDIEKDVIITEQDII